jgi:hypothetical protein
MEFVEKTVISAPPRTENLCRRLLGSASWSCGSTLRSFDKKALSEEFEAGLDPTIRP